MPDLIEATPGAKVTQGSLAQTSTRTNADPESAPATTALTGQVKQTGSSPASEEDGQGRLTDVKGRDSEQDVLKSTPTSGKGKTV